MDKLERMAPVLLQKAKYKSDTRLIKEGVRSYLYCISNIKKFASEVFEGNTTGNVSLSNEVNKLFWCENMHRYLSADITASSDEQFSEKEALAKL